MVIKHIQKEIIFKIYFKILKNKNIIIFKKLLLLHKKKYISFKVYQYKLYKYKYSTYFNYTNFIWNNIFNICKYQFN